MRAIAQNNTVESEVARWNIPVSYQGVPAAFGGTAGKT